MPTITIIGAGLAGCEAAWQLARRGVAVRLLEMRPEVMTPAHSTGGLAELVCSNSLKAASTERAPGLLKEELKLLGSLLMDCALATAVPAGGALAVDRAEFSREVETRLLALGNVELVRHEAAELPEDLCILATGPMTSAPIVDALRRLAPFGTLRFFDAVSPIVSADSIDREIAFEASRYDKGDAGYLNCPFTEEEYAAFYDALVTAEVAGSREIPEKMLFEGCQPIEEIARKGRDAIRYGAMKPVGLMDPRTGRRPHAVCQLRQENREATMYNLVGFQTGLRWPEQERVFRMIPGLGHAEFLRLGVMHANIFVDAPRLLDPFMRLRERPNLMIAGQLSGVEGYVESTLSGLYCGLNAARLLHGEEPLELPSATVSGSLLRYLATADSPDFQPMNANFGLLPPIESPPRNKKDRRGVMVERALEEMRRFAERYGVDRQPA